MALPTPWQKARDAAFAKELGLIGDGARESRTPGSALVNQMAAKGRAVSATGDFLTRPGAGEAPRNPNAFAHLQPAGVKGFTPDRSWNAFFPNRSAAAPTGSSFMARLRSGAAAAPSLAPTVPTDAAAMAETWNGMQKPVSIFSPDSVAQRAGIRLGTGMSHTAKQASIRGFMDARARSADDYFAQGMDTSMRFLDRTGAGIAAPRSGAVQAGTSLSSKYGSARVDTPSTLFMERLKRDNQVLKSGPRIYELPDL